MEILQTAKTININDFVNFAKNYQFKSGTTVKFTFDDLYIKEGKTIQKLKKTEFFITDFIKNIVIDKMVSSNTSTTEGKTTSSGSSGESNSFGSMSYAAGIGVSSYQNSGSLNLNSSSVGETSAKKEVLNILDFPELYLKDPLSNTFERFDDFSIPKLIQDDIKKQFDILHTEYRKNFIKKADCAFSELQLSLLKSARFDNFERMEENCKNRYIDKIKQSFVAEFDNLCNIQKYDNNKAAYSLPLIENTVYYLTKQGRENTNYFHLITSISFDYFDYFDYINTIKAEVSKIKNEYESSTIKMLGVLGELGEIKTNPPFASPFFAALVISVALNIILLALFLSCNYHC